MVQLPQKTHFIPLHDSYGGFRYGDLQPVIFNGLYEFGLESVDPHPGGNVENQATEIGTLRARGIEKGAEFVFRESGLHEGVPEARGEGGVSEHVRYGLRQRVGVQMKGETEEGFFQDNGLWGILGGSGGRRGGGGVEVGFDDVRELEGEECLVSGVGFGSRG